MALTSMNMGPMQVPEALAAATAATLEDAVDAAPEAAKVAAPTDQANDDASTDNVSKQPSGDASPAAGHNVRSVQSFPEDMRKHACMHTCARLFMSVRPACSCMHIHIHVNTRAGIYLSSHLCISP